MRQNLFTERLHLSSARLLLAMALAVGILVLLLTQLTHAQGSWTNGQDASGVLGQPDFTSDTGGVTSSRMDFPMAVAVDPTSGKVFVADTFNDRVLRFSSAAASTNGAAAEAVLGQVDFTSHASGTTASLMDGPGALYVDSAGRLWVSEWDNNRVLRFDNAASKGNGASADGVLGQPNFTSSVSGTTASTLRHPSGLYVDSSGRLWVADAENHRVLRFDNAAAKANGANADGVLGQADFTSNVMTTTQNGMSWAYAVVGDSSGRLFVADLANSRVLRFDNAAAKANGANADGVLGQASFTTDWAACSQTGMNYPRGVGLDDSGRLYVSEQYNHRVLIFEGAATKANGAAADNVLGQADFTSGSENRGGSVAANTIRNPRQVFFDNATQRLWVADGGNQRVLRYGFSTLQVIKSVAGVGGSTTSLPLGSVVTYTIVLSNSGAGVASGVVMTDALPDGVSFGNWLDQGSALPPAPPDNIITWGPYDIPANTEYSIRFTAVITTASTFGGKTISNMAYITATNADPHSDGAFFTTANTLPTISNISDQETYINTPIVIPFTIGDAETQPDSLTLSRASSNTGLVPILNIVFGGSGANRTVTITPAADVTGTSTITITVSDGTDTRSDSFVLTVVKHRIWLPMSVKNWSQ